MCRLQLERRRRGDDRADQREYLDVAPVEQRYAIKIVALAVTPIDNPRDQRGQRQRSRDRLRNLFRRKAQCLVAEFLDLFLQARQFGLERGNVVLTARRFC